MGLVRDLLQMKREEIIVGIKAVIATVGLTYLWKLPIVSIYPLLLLVVCIYLFKKKNVVESRHKVCTMMGAIILSGFLVLGILEGFLCNGWKIACIKLLFVFMGSYFLFQWFLENFFIVMDGFSDSFRNKSKKIIRFYKNKTVFLISFIVIMGLWLPVWLAHAPALMNSDSINQIMQMFGNLPLSNHHPVVHTMYVKVLYQLTRILGIDDINISFGIISFIQMMIMAAICAGAVTYVYKRLKSIPVICGMLGFYVLIAYHAYYSITIWKDTIHAGITSMFLILLHAYYLTEDKRKKHILLLANFVIGVMFCLFRSNGLYALLLWAVFLFLYELRNRDKKLLLTVVAVLVVSNVIKGPVYSQMEIAESIFTEKISIPLQQIACVIANDRELTKEETEMISRIIVIDRVQETYVNHISDPMKSLVEMCGHRDYLEDHKGEYLKLWISLGIKYPKDYLFAWINQTKGYWYPDTSYWTYFGCIYENELGLQATPIISADYTTKLDKWVERYDEVPIYGSFWNLGVYTWVLVGTFFYSFYRRQWFQCLLESLLLCIWMTLLISTPVYAEFRYMYAIILAMPLIIGLSLEEKRPIESRKM